MEEAGDDADQTLKTARKDKDWARPLRKMMRVLSMELRRLRGGTTPLLTIQALKALKSVVVLTDAGRLRG